jgi:glycosyltransferase involved in cell wall biosynthesis
MIIAVNTRFLLANKLEGIGWYTFEVLKRMVAAHPDDQFIFFFDRPFDPDFVFGANVKPIVLSPPARHPFLFIAWFEWSVARALKRYKADVFLSTDNFLSLRTAVPTCLILHDMIWHHQPMRGLVGWYYRFFMPRFLAKADRVVTVSEYVRQDALSVFPELKNKIFVAQNGCRIDFQPLSESEKLATCQQLFAQNTEGGLLNNEHRLTNNASRSSRDSQLPPPQYPDNIEETESQNPTLSSQLSTLNSQKYFVFVGAVHPRKNVHRLIAAFDLFKKQTDSDWKLVIVGRFAWETNAVKTAFDQAQYQKDIVFTGYVPNEAVPKIVGAAAAVTYVSLAEGFGIPILEAMNADVPVLTSPVTSIPEVAGEAALYVNPESVENIAVGMKRLYGNPVLRQELVEKGRIQREKFSWDKTAALVYEHLEGLVRVV